MSKLVKPKVKAQPVIDEVKSLSDVAIRDILKVCQKMAVEQAEHAFTKFYQAYLDAMTREIEEATSNQAAMEYAAIQRLMRQMGAEIKQYYCGYISEGYVRFYKKKLDTHLTQDDDDRESESDVTLADLSLVENRQLEESIALARIAQRAEDKFAENLWVLNQRFSILNAGIPITDASNPVSPVQFCNALRRALKLINLEPKIKTLLFNVYDQSFLKLVKWVVDDTNGYLIKQGVLPTLKYRAQKAVVAAPSSPSSHETFKPAERFFAGDPSDGATMGVALDTQSEAQLLSEIGHFQAVSEGAPGPQVTSRTPVGKTYNLTGGVPVQVPADSVVAPHDLVVALNALQPIAIDVSKDDELKELEVAADIATIVSRLAGELTTEEKEPIVEEDDLHTIDLVGMMFEFMLEDGKLPDRVKTLLSHLHTPFLKLAFIDKSFFENKDHPARVLLNRLDEAGSQWIDKNGRSEFGVFEKIRDVVYQIMHCTNNEVKLITELLLDFNAAMKKSERRRELTERRAKEKALGEDKLHISKITANSDIQERIKGQDLPSITLLFLLQSWSDVLSFSLLRHGADSQGYRDGLTLVDNLVWCSRPKISADDCARQKALFEPMMADISAGLELIGCDESIANKYLSGIASMVRLTLKAKRADPAPAAEREEWVRDAAQKAGQTSAVDVPVTSEEKKMIENLHLVEFGTWLERRDGHQLKISWHNARTDEYLLVNHKGQREQILSALALARSLIAEEITIVSGSSKPFFERALTHIRDTLRERRAVTAS